MNHFWKRGHILQGRMRNTYLISFEQSQLGLTNIWIKWIQKLLSRHHAGRKGIQLNVNSNLASFCNWKGIPFDGKVFLWNLFSLHYVQTCLTYVISIRWKIVKGSYCLWVDDLQRDITPLVRMNYAFKFISGVALNFSPSSPPYHYRYRQDDTLQLSYTWTWNQN